MQKVSKIIANNLFKQFNIKNNIIKYWFSTTINDDLLEINLNNKKCQFPMVWLRDNCQCAECFHQDSKSRIIDWSTFEVDPKLVEIQRTTDGKKINIKWENGHISVFHKDWLYKRNFSRDSQEKYLTQVYRQERCTWNNSNFSLILKKYDYEAILSNNKSLQTWLESLRHYGVALITNVPDKEEAGTNIAERVEMAKQTHYGKKFIVKAKPGTTNVAYLSKNLQMHTDLPYYEYKPGVNLLHCVTQAAGNGGENLLTDGLYVAQLLKQHEPQHYEILTNTLVDWEDIGMEKGNKFYSIYRSPVICENLQGEIVRINHSIPQRGTHFNEPIEKIKPWYKAMKHFVDLIHKNAVVYRMNPGEILCFDNLRLLHGRKEYHDTDNNIRHIVGVYLDWDYIFSRIRVLSKTH